MRIPLQFEKQSHISVLSFGQQLKYEFQLLTVILFYYSFKFLPRVSLILRIEHRFVFYYLINVPVEFDDLCRHTTTDAIRRHTLGNYRSGCNGRSSADGYSREQCHVACNPYIFFYYYVFVISFRLVRFGYVGYELADYPCVITSVNRQPFSNGAMSLADELGIDCTDIRPRANTTPITYTNILIISYI